MSHGFHGKSYGYRHDIRHTRSKSSDDVLSGIVMTTTLSGCLGIGWERPLLDWVTENVTVSLNSGDHDTGGGRDLIPVGRRTTTLCSHLPEQGC